MSDASLPLQGAIVAALTADAGVTALVGARVYDEPPADAEFPYVQIGTSQVLPQIADGYDGADIALTLDGWSRATGQPEIKRIGAAVDAALNGAALSIAGFRLIEIVPEQMQYLRDPDGITHHGVFVYRARVEPV